MEKTKDNSQRLQDLKNKKPYTVKNSTAEFILYLHDDNRAGWTENIARYHHSESSIVWKQQLIKHIFIEENLSNSQILANKQLETEYYKNSSEYVLTLQKNNVKIPIGNIIIRKDKEPNIILIANYKTIPRSGYIAESLSTDFYTINELNTFITTFIHKATLENFSDSCRRTIFTDYIHVIKRNLSKSNIINNLEDIKHLINKEYLYNLLTPKQKNVINMNDIYIQDTSEKSSTNKSIKIVLWNNKVNPADSQLYDLFELIFDFNKKEKDLYICNYTTAKKITHKITTVDELESFITNIMKSCKYI